MSKGKSLHPKMDASERAKQFLPFAALKGYEEALRRTEKEVEESMREKNEPIEDN